MAGNVRRVSSRIALMLGSMFIASSANAGQISVRTFGAEELRVETIAYRIGAANANSCASPQMRSGLILHDLTQYDLSVRPAVSRAFSLYDGIGVLDVVPGSVADQAGLEVDDEILAIDGRSIKDPQAVEHAPQSYQRLERFSSALRQALSLRVADLLVRRHGQLLHLKLRGQPGCGGDAFVTSSPDLNAWSDGSRIFVSSALMGFTRSDDELAFVIAHEMAHNILGHSSQHDAHGLLGLFGVGAAKIRREEKAADLYAVPLIRSGGFQPAGAIAILERLQTRLWWDVSLDHPGFGERIRTVSAAIAQSLTV